MNRKKHLKWMASLLIVMLAGACSTGEDEEMLMEQSINIPDTDKASTSVPKLMYRFRGIWTVDEVSADTTTVRVATAQPRNSVEFHGFPIKEMMKRMLPKVKVAKITDYEMDELGWLPDDEVLYSNMLSKYEDALTQCLQSGVGQTIRCVGMSEKSLYLEFTQTELYLPFVVTTDEGQLIPVTAVIQPSLSKSVLNVDGSLFTCTLTVTKVKYTEISESDEVVWEAKLEPEMRLKYTSIKRIDYPSSGN
jgi:hypothetical protein